MSGYPSRRLSSIGGITTGWRSSLESRPHQTIGSFFVETLIAAALFIGVVFLLIWLSSLFPGWPNPPGLRQRNDAARVGV